MPEQTRGPVTEVIRGDITLVAADAIVNAANRHLEPGGGVDGAIHRAGGQAILADLRARYGEPRRCPTGSAVVTVAGRLPAQWVIHAVGPRWTDGRSGEAELLASTYRASLACAEELGATSITFPAISSGIYGYPVPEGARVALESMGTYFADDHPTSIARVTFVLFSEETLATFASELEQRGAPSRR